MVKKVKFTESQIKEIAGNDIDYLSNGDFKEYGGLGQTSITGKLSSGEDGEPITGDKFANMQAQQTYYGQTLMPYGRWSRITEKKINDKKKK